MSPSLDRSVVGHRDAAVVRGARASSPQRAREMARSVAIGAREPARRVGRDRRLAPSPPARGSRSRAAAQPSSGTVSYSRAIRSPPPAPKMCSRGRIRSTRADSCSRRRRAPARDLAGTSRCLCAASCSAMSCGVVTITAPAHRHALRRASAGCRRCRAACRRPGNRGRPTASASAAAVSAPTSPSARATTIGVLFVDEETASTSLPGRAPSSGSKNFCRRASSGRCPTGTPSMTPAGSDRRCRRRGCRPWRLPRASASARLTAAVDLPTPPLPGRNRDDVLHAAHVRAHAQRGAVRIPTSSSHRRANGAAELLCQIASVPSPDSRARHRPEPPHHAVRRGASHRATAMSHRGRGPLNRSSAPMCSLMTYQPPSLSERAL